MDPSYRNPYTQQWNIGYAHQLNSYSVLEVDFVHVLALFFFFKQKTAYDITYGDWSSDVCSSDLPPPSLPAAPAPQVHGARRVRGAVRRSVRPAGPISRSSRRGPGGDGHSLHGADDRGRADASAI